MFTRSFGALRPQWAARLSFLHARTPAPTHARLQVERVLPLGAAVTAVGELAAVVDYPNGYPVSAVPGLQADAFCRGG